MSDQQVSPGPSPKTTNATSAGFVTTAITVLNIALGFGFQSLIAFALGLGALADAFQLTWAIVTFGTTVFYTLVTTVLVPRVHDGSNSVRLGDARHLAVFGTIATALQVFAAIFTAQPLTDLLLYSAPSHLLAAITAPAVTLAYLEHRFALAAIGNVYNGLGLLAAAAIAVGAGPTPANLGIALTAGYTTQFLLTALPLRNNLRSVDWRAAIGTRSIVGLILFTMLTKLQPVLERTISESFGIGSTAALGFGQKISQGLLLLGAFGLAITATGSLSRAFASGDGPLTARLFGRTLISTFITSTLIIAFFIPFSRLSVQILFQRGEFTAYDTNSVFS
ncbi:MAG: hypothetical protein INR62_11745, partial [Rhodospirillales bacterium]|nr:hypothetical protein [Acetobacter sp.]